MKKPNIDQLFFLLVGLLFILNATNVAILWRIIQLQESIGGQNINKGPVGLQIGTHAPGFTLLDNEGKKISISDYIGQSVILMFSQVNCKYSIEMYPELIKLQKKHPKISILLISSGLDEENRRFVEENTFNFPILFDNGELAPKYQVPGTPYFFIIDQKGIIVNLGSAHSLNDLEEMINVLD